MNTYRVEIALDEKQNTQIERAAKLMNMKRKPFLEAAAMAYSESIIDSARKANAKKVSKKVAAKQPKGAK